MPQNVAATGHPKETALRADVPLNWKAVRVGAEAKFGMQQGDRP